jgi:hypothetical protein
MQAYAPSSIIIAAKSRTTLKAFSTAQDDAHPLLLLWHAGDDEKQLATLRSLGYRDPQWTLARMRRAAATGCSKCRSEPSAHAAAGPAHH